MEGQQEIGPKPGSVQYSVFGLIETHHQNAFRAHARFLLEKDTGEFSRVQYGVVLLFSW